MQWVYTVEILVQAVGHDTFRSSLGVLSSQINGLRSKVGTFSFRICASGSEAGIESSKVGVPRVKAGTCGLKDCFYADIEQEMV